MMSKASEDLPDPETPVTTVKVLCGISKSMFLRLWTRAPRTTILSVDMPEAAAPASRDRKSTRLNSSHLVISYAVFCLKKKNEISVDMLCQNHRAQLAGTQSNAALRCCEISDILNLSHFNPR